MFRTENRLGDKLTQIINRNRSREIFCSPFSKLIDLFLSLFHSTILYSSLTLTWMELFRWMCQKQRTNHHSSSSKKEERRYKDIWMRARRQQNMKCKWTNVQWMKRDWKSSKRNSCARDKIKQVRTKGTFKRKRRKKKTKERETFLLCMKRATHDDPNVCAFKFLMHKVLSNGLNVV